MTNRKWVKEQFKSFKKYKPRYREALIITSFIESITRRIASSSGNSKEKNFKRSLEILGLKIDNNNEKISNYKKNCQYKKDCLKKINIVRVQRNELLHDIIKRRFPKKYIDNTIKKMTKNIETICAKSNLVRNYFKKNYKFNPTMEI